MKRRVEESEREPRTSGSRTGGKHSAGASETAQCDFYTRGRKVLTHVRGSSCVLSERLMYGPTNRMWLLTWSNVQ